MLCRSGGAGSGIALVGTGAACYSKLQICQNLWISTACSPCRRWRGRTMQRGRSISPRTTGWCAIWPRAASRGSSMAATPLLYHITLADYEPLLELAGGIETRVPRHPQRGPGLWPRHRPGAAAPQAQLSLRDDSALRRSARRPGARTGHAGDRRRRRGPAARLSERRKQFRLR